MFEELFNYESYDHTVEDVYTFFNCTLKRNLGKYWVGMSFASITFFRHIDDGSFLELRREVEADPVCTYQVHLRIGVETK